MEGDQIKPTPEEIPQASTQTADQSTTPSPVIPAVGTAGGMSALMKLVIVLAVAVAAVVTILIFKNQIFGMFGSDNNNADDIATTSTASPASSRAAQNSCKNLNEDAFNDMVRRLGLNQPGLKWVATDKYPEEFPDDFPKYENATVQAYVSTDVPASKDNPASKSFIVVTCSNDDEVKIKKYFEGLTFSATGWESLYEAAQRQYSQMSNVPPEVKQTILQGIKNQLLTGYVRGGVPATGKAKVENIMSVGIIQGKILYSFAIPQ